MRHVLQGAFAGALLYPLVWYSSSPAPTPRAVAPGIDSPPSAVGLPGGNGGSTAPPFEEDAEAARYRVASDRELSRHASREGPPPASSSNPPSPALPGLPEALSRMQELQRYATNPEELAQRVQTTEMDPEKLAELKALAELFVQLPPSRGEPYLSSSGDSPSVSAPR